MKGTTHYINTDLELAAKADLTPLADALTSRGLRQLSPKGFPDSILTSHQMRDSCFRILLCLVLSGAPGAQGHDATNPKPDPYAAHYFAQWGAVRGFLFSDMVVTGTMRLDADSTAHDRKGTVVVKDLLYGKSDGVPKTVPFERVVSAFIESQANTPFFGWFTQPMDKIEVIVFLRHDEGNQVVVKVFPASGHAKLMDELRLLQTAGIRIDNPDALAKPFDSELNPFAEDVRKRLLERVRVNSK